MVETHLYRLSIKHKHQSLGWCFSYFCNAEVNESTRLKWVYSHSVNKNYYKGVRMRFSDRYITKKIIHQNERVEIYVATDTVQQQDVIIKSLKSDLMNPLEVSKFRKEYSILKGLDHDNIVKVIEYYEGHQVYLVLEYVEALSLREQMLDQGMDLDQFYEIATQALKALEHVHVNHVIHKDINPSNLLWDANQKKLTLIDFNISEIVSHESQGFCSPNNLQGTLGYISPEQSGRMNRLIDYRTDLYSLGITFYELLTGKRPFIEDDRLKLVHAHIAKVPRALKEVKEDLPQALSDLVSKLLEKDASARYQSEQGILSDLDSILKMDETANPFVLGKQDSPTKFVLSQEIYGRDDEIEELLHGYNLAQNGGFMNMFVTGESGIGKTTVIQELFKPVTYSKGIFIYGKFDQFKRDKPYSAIINSFQDFTRIVLAEDEVVLNLWKDKILGAVGSSGQILIDLVPDLEMIIGPQPEVSPLSGIEAQNRFNYIIHKFIQAISTAEHPLVIFIDDLQWVDSASLSLLKMLLEDIELEYVMLIGAYRDNEVNRSHPLQMALTDLESRANEIYKMHLEILKYDHVLSFIEDTFVGVNRSEDLAEVVRTASNGNAFFIKEMLKKLYIDRVVDFDYAQMKWLTDLEALNRFSAALDIDSFMNQVFDEMEEKLIKLLSYLACIGRKQSISTLCKWGSYTEQEIDDLIKPAIKEGLISKDYQDQIGFIHDKVQEAVYSRMQSGERKEIHNSIAQEFLHAYERSQNSDLLFDIIAHLEDGNVKVLELTEEQLAKLYYLSGSKALAASANERAFKYLKSAAEYSLDSWSTRYNETLEIFNAAAEAAYLTGAFDQLNVYHQIITENASVVKDKAQIYGLVIQSYMSQNMHLQGVELALQSIQEFGVSIPMEPTMEDAGAAFQSVGQALARFENLDDLLELQLLEDENLKAVMKILSDIIPIVFNAAPSHLPLVVCKMIEISVCDGLSSHTPFAFSLYALLLCGVLGDLNKGTEFGDLAIKLVDQLGATEEIAKTYNMVGLHVMHFKDHLNRVTRTLEMAYLKGLETGDHLFAGFAGHGYCLNYYLAGNELNRTRKVFENYTHSLENIKQGTQTTFQNAYNQAIVNLIEDVEQPWIFNGPVFDESQELPEIEKRGHKTALLVSYFNKMYIAYLFGAYQEAYEYARKMEENLDAGVGLILIPNYYAFDSLIRLQLLEAETDEEVVNEYLDIIQKNQNELLVWCALGKENYEHRYLMVEGERFAYEGKYSEARLSYEEALDNVKTAGYQNEEALYRERIAEFYKKHNKLELYEHYLMSSYIAYRHWGANNKAKQLRVALDQVGSQIRTEDSIITVQESSTTRDFNVEMDLASILKASQTIAEEIVYINLFERLLEILIENAGAERAMILNYLENGEIFYARKELGQAMEVEESIEDIKSIEMPLQVLNYVNNSKKAVLIRSARNDPFFSYDEYIKKNDVESILCFPVIRQGNIIAVVYVENNLAAGVFTNQRVDVLNLLSAQIAISLKNATMYRELESIVQERTLELEKQNTKLERLNIQLQTISVTDGLTQVFNRRKLDEILYYERERYLRYGHPVSVILLDVDKFKNVNDTYGHHVGDQVLINIAELIKSSVRNVDMVGRWGGEEFMIVCPSTNLNQSKTVAESIRKVIEAKRFDEVGAVTASLGVVEINRNDDIEHLIQRVDALLYKAKGLGRNRVES